MQALCAAVVLAFSFCVQACCRVCVYIYIEYMSKYWNCSKCPDAHTHLLTSLLMRGRRVAAKPLLSVEQMVKQSTLTYSSSIIWGLKRFGLAWSIHHPRLKAKGILTTRSTCGSPGLEIQRSNAEKTKNVLMYFWVMVWYMNDARSYVNMSRKHVWVRFCVTPLSCAPVNVLWCV